MGGGGIGGALLGALGGALAPFTGGASLLAIGGGALAGGLLGEAMTPKAPDTSSMSPSTMTANTGAVVGQGEGKTFDISEQDTQRGSVTKKRLGTKQLQIPLANASAGGVNIGATTGSTGVNV